MAQGGNVDVNVQFKASMAKFSDPRALSILKDISGFLKSMTEWLDTPQTVEAAAERVQGFYQDVKTAMRGCDLWATANEEDVTQDLESLERYVTSKLYVRLIQLDKEAAEDDNVIGDRLCKLSHFVQWTNIVHEPELSTLADPQVVQEVVQHLQAFDNKFKAPFDLIVCMMKAFGSITEHLARHQEDTGGADALLPLMNYCIMKAEMQQLARQVSFISNFRNQDLFHGEHQYYLTTLGVCKAFFLQLTPASLNMEADEFVAHMVQLGDTSVLDRSRSNSAALEGAAAEGAIDLLSGEPAGAAPLVPAVDAAAVPDLLSGLVIDAPAAPGPSPGGERAEQAPAAAATPATATGGAAASATGISQPLAVNASVPPPPEKLPGTSELLEEGAASLLSAPEALQAATHRYPFLHATAGDLSLVEVSQLLRDYQQLVLRHESLLAALQHYTR